MAKKNTNKMVEMLLNTIGVETKQQKRKRVLGSIITGAGSVIMTIAPIALEVAVECADAKKTADAKKITKDTDGITRVTNTSASTTGSIPAPTTSAKPAIVIPTAVKEISQFYLKTKEILTTPETVDDEKATDVRPAKQCSNEEVTLDNIQWIKFDIEGNLRKLDEFITAKMTTDCMFPWKKEKLTVLSGRIKELISEIKYKFTYEEIAKIVEKHNAAIREIKILKW